MNISYFELNFPLTYTNWLPFYLAGYNQQTCYTYRMEDISDTDKVFSLFFYTKKYQVHRAQKLLHIDFSMSADEFYELQCKQISSKGEKNFISKKLVCNVINTARQRKQGVIVRATDEKGNTHAAVFVVYDKNSAYELLTAISPEYRDTGASTFVVWEAIKKLSKVTKAWDFAGSMIEEVEHSNRQFGTLQTPYFKISKYIKPIEFLKLLIK